MVVADGWPLVTASKILRDPLPERVTGSDLVPLSLEHSKSRGGIKVFLLGAASGIADLAADRIQQRWPHVQVVGTYSPPFGFEHNPEENQQILDRIELARPDLLVVGFGAPKQEIWLSRHRDQLRARVAIAAGATIDFLAGKQVRAPRWVQAARLEWFFRAATDPKRLAARYLHDAFVFPKILLAEFVRRRPASQARF